MRRFLPSRVGFWRVGVVGTLVLVCLTWSSLRAQNAPDAPIPETVRFNRDIRPILSDKCFTCHGPSSTGRRANLRLDDEAAAKAKVIVPGDPEHSLVIQRITSTDTRRRMPRQGEALSERDVKILTRWIEQGAEYEPWWSFAAPVRAQLPTVKDASWPKNEIDYFILDRLEKEGLRPSPEADRTTIIRRVTLDLTGLPPTLAEVDAFLADESPDAYEKVVDRLLASPHYGERMAATWMAVARFADTIGYQADYARDMHRWRDWVIGAYNRNLPFDQFTTEQLAGDLLPNATQDQITATGFNRLHRLMAETGSNPDEYWVENVLDRTTTMGTVWLGLTLGCARCHDHKYDPIAQKDVYQFYSFFNNSAESGVGLKGGNSPPVMAAPTPEQQARLKELEDKVTAAEEQVADFRPEIEKAQRAWERSLEDGNPVVGAMSDNLVAYFPLSSEAENRFDGKRFVEGGTINRLGPKNAFTMAAWIEPDAPSGPILTRTSMNAKLRGYQFMLKDGKLQLNLATGYWMDEAIHVETKEPVALSGRHHVAATYDGSYQVWGVRVYVDGKQVPLNLLFNAIGYPSLELPADPLRIGAGGGPERFRGSISDVRLYDVPLSPAEIVALAEPTTIAEIAAIDPTQRTNAQAGKIDAYFLENQAIGLVDRVRRTGRQNQQRRRQRETAKVTLERSLAAVKDARREKEAFEDTLPTVMVMQELPEPRQAHILLRGNWETPGEKVDPGTPSWLPPMPAGAPRNRLGLAQWLMDPSNPLTARVVVNRYWEKYFGTGLVKSTDNFGSQGDQPSHPELLDWLATDYPRVNWDVKGMQKLIVTSATYRQASRVTPALLERDPDNRLLARAPRFRLPGEMVRDQALAIAGLLSPTIGGPSVKPYQPEGLWDVTNNTYDPGHGEDLYRRSLYTYWKRSVAPPSLAMFDVAERDNPAVVHNRTNTPLQALALMNDVTYLEAARMFAERMLTEGGTTDQDRIAYAFRLATAREPNETQFTVLLEELQSFRERYRTDEEAALKVLSQGEHPRNETLDVSELAAHAVVASLILNLDQVVTRE